MIKTPDTWATGKLKPHLFFCSSGQQSNIPHTRLSHCLIKMQILHQMCTYNSTKILEPLLDIQTCQWRTNMRSGVRLMEQRWSTCFKSQNMLSYSKAERYLQSFREAKLKHPISLLIWARYFTNHLLTKIQHAPQIKVTKRQQWF